MISVLIPVYNGAGHVRSAIESVFAQTFTDWELVVLDDGSRDATVRVVEELLQSYEGRQSVRLLTQPNSGIGPARNRLVREARGEWVAFLDHDDTWAPHKLQRQVQLIRERVGLIHTRDVFVYENGEHRVGTWRPAEGGHALDHVLPDCRVNMSSAMVRRKAILDVGNFDGAVSKAEDWLMWLKLASRWEFAFAPEPLTWTLKHAGSASEPNAEWYRGEREVLERHILPSFDELYANLPKALRQSYRAKAHAKLGAIASLEAEALDRQGLASEARALHLEAIRRSPTRKGAWLRLGKHLIGS